MIKKFLFLIIAGILIQPADSAPIRKFKPLQPMQIPQIQENLNQVQQDYNNYSNEKYPKITILEESLFNRSYEGENIYTRLSRLEKKLLRKDFSELSLASRVDNLFSNIDTGIMYGIKNNDLMKIEQKVIGRTYPNDDTESRITRLEKEMLGAMQGGNLKERFQTIKTASKHYNSFPEIVESQNPYMPQFNSYYNGYNPTYHHNNGWNSYWSNNTYGRNYKNPSNGVANLLKNMAQRVMGIGMNGAMMTGFTPPIYDPYNPYTMQPSTTEQDYYWGNTGGYMRNRNIGNGSTVRILD